MRLATLTLVFSLFAFSLSGPAIACSSGTNAQREAWAIQRQIILNRTQKVVGTFRELSRTESSSFIPARMSLQDGRDTQVEIPYTKVTGEILNKNGNVLYQVQFTRWNDLGVCRWNSLPLNGEFGTFYLEKSKNGVREITHFAIRRKK